MSQGELCGHKISVGTHINSNNEIVVRCDLYKGHEGDHSVMFVHCKNSGKGHIANYGLGRIVWNESIIKGGENE